MKKNFVIKHNKIDIKKTVLVSLIILCVVWIVYDPIARFYNDGILHLTGYKPLMLSARDSIWMLFGILGATLLLENKSYCGVILLNFYAIGVIVSLIIEFMFNILYYQNMILYILSLIAAMCIIVMNFLKPMLRIKTYLVLFLSLLLSSILLNILFIDINIG